MEFFEACLNSSKEFIAAIGRHTQGELTARYGVGEGGDISLKADLLSEEIFAKALSGFGRIYSEESGYIGDGDATIYLDPLDGSDNFAARIPYYGVSVCLVGTDGSKKSFILNFANGDIFYKENEPLFANLYNDDALRVYAKTAASKSAIFEKAHANPKIANAFFKKNIKFRSLGALALSLVYSQNALFTLFVGEPRVFDIIAALHFLDGAYIFNANGILLTAQNRDIFEEVLEIVTSIEGGQNVL